MSKREKQSELTDLTIPLSRSLVTLSYHAGLGDSRTREGGVSRLGIREGGQMGQSGTLGGDSPSPAILRNGH